MPDGDTNTGNELQNFSINLDTIFLSQGNYIVLPPDLDTDDQTLAYANDTLRISEGNYVALPPDTDDQTLSLSNDTLFISEGNYVVVPNFQDDQDWVGQGTGAMYQKNFSDKIGLGTKTPKFALSLEAVGGNSYNAGILSRGYTGYGDSVENIGAGVRMFWNPRTASFRSGYVTGTNWDHDSLGLYSVAMGYNNKATANSSTAFGYSSHASGNYSLAIGLTTTASGYGAFSSGSSTVASGNYATALGSRSEASGIYSFANGIFNVSSEQAATSI